MTPIKHETTCRSILISTIGAPNRDSAYLYVNLSRFLRNISQLNSKTNSRKMQNKNPLSFVFVKSQSNVVKSFYCAVQG